MDVPHMILEVGLACEITTAPSLDRPLLKTVGFSKVHASTGEPEALMGHANMDVEVRPLGEPLVATLPGALEILPIVGRHPAVVDFDMPVQIVFGIAPEGTEDTVHMLITHVSLKQRFARETDSRGRTRGPWALFTPKLVLCMLSVHMVPESARRIV